MKKSITIMSLWALAVMGYAQGNNFSIGLILPESNSTFTQDNLKKLEGKLIQLINNSNQAIFGFQNDIVIYPIITLNETSKAEGGMQSITISSVDLSIFIKQVGINTTYNSLSLKLKGSGSNEKQAINDALNHLKGNDERFSKFVAEAKLKIEKYYQTNCKTIIQSAENNAAKNEYEEALAKLNSIPDFVSNCFLEAQTKSLEVFKKLQTSKCAQLITNAQTAIATQDFTLAIEYLQLIDPSSNCYSEAKTLIKKIETKTNKKIEEENNMQARRINAIKEIAKAYYANAIRNVRYNIIVK